MNIKSSHGGSKLVLRIYEHITTINDVNEIRSHMMSSSFDELELVINDAFVMPSALIGLLLKEVQADKKRVYIQAKDELIELLKELNLQSVFKLTKIG